MNTVQTRPPFVSTFLSHSSDDSELVEKVAKRLGRRGVLAWLDKKELLEMGPLDVALKRAVQQQATLTIFLSEASSNSEWCKDELKWAIEAQKGSEHILPVYLGDPLQLIRKHDLLRTRFLDAFGKVNQLGYWCQQNPTSPNPDAIAEKIAATAYKRLIPESWSEVVIVLDQRGSGQRRGFPPMPDNIARLNAPTLIFRPSLDPRQKGELLTDSDWDDMATTMTGSLSNALGTLRRDFCKVIVLSNAQTGLAWAVGKHFDRTDNVELYGYDRLGNLVTNEGQERLKLLPGGNPDRAQLVNSETNRLNETQPEVALGIGNIDYAHDAHQAVPHLPLLWIETSKIENSEQAMQLAKDIVATCKRLYREHSVRELALFWATANHVSLLAAANLTAQHALPKIKYMERDHYQGKYVHLPMPGDAPLS
ncbi:MAG: TIR domain-containing protein [Leptolyngbya sp. SIO1E4]|nr:TIR domain-containing protein [Leptolyngbya sp. SIO1E4]